MDRTSERKFGLEKDGRLQSARESNRLKSSIRWLFSMDHRFWTCSPSHGSSPPLRCSGRRPTWTEARPEWRPDVAQLFQPPTWRKEDRFSHGLGCFCPCQLASLSKMPENNIGQFVSLPVVTAQVLKNVASVNEIGEQARCEISGRIEDRSSVQTERQTASGD